MEKHYLNEYGTELLVDTGTDLTGATVMKLCVKKPDGGFVEWYCEQYSQNKKYLRYVLRIGDFDQVGEYKIQSMVESAGWSGVGETTSFIVYERFA